eukprot:SAG11_NODE_1075_length_5967_cov_7.848841_5_plen_173_part_00
MASRRRRTPLTAGGAVPSGKSSDSNIKGGGGASASSGNVALRVTLLVLSAIVCAAFVLRPVDEDVCDVARPNWPPTALVPAQPFSPTGTVVRRLLAELDEGTFAAEYGRAAVPVLLTGAVLGAATSRSAVLSAFGDRPLATGKSTGITANSGRGAESKVVLVCLHVSARSLI